MARSSKEDGDATVGRAGPPLPRLAQRVEASCAQHPRPRGRCGSPTASPGASRRPSPRRLASPPCHDRVNCLTGEGLSKERRKSPFSSTGFPYGHPPAAATPTTTPGGRGFTPLPPGHEMLLLLGSGLPLHRLHPLSPQGPIGHKKTPAPRGCGPIPRVH
jgi:hypothetical protein